MTIYLAGPITGIPDYNRPAFAKAAERLPQVSWGGTIYSELHPGLEIISPLDLCADVLDNQVEWALVDVPPLTDAQLGEMPLDLWWAAMADVELERTIPKCIEYGDDGDDLVAIGHDIDMIIRKDPPPGVSSTQWQSELGVFFYLRGKVARMLAAFKKGRLPSFDTFFDTKVYAAMLMRIRHHGLWS